MNEMTQFDLDSDGKIDLNQVYEQPDPRSYYQTLSRLDYQIPASAEPIFRRTIRTLRQLRRKRALTMLDVGSSYGVNAAILKHRFSLPSLFELYGPETNLTLPTSEELVTRDRELFGPDRSDGSLVTVGLDVSGEAIGYARDAGIIDHGIAANLEERDPTAAEAEVLGPVDLVVSTGAIGYVGAPTFARIIGAAEGRPWIAVFALRMFPMDGIARMLGDVGYRLLRLPGETFRQRRFANPNEREEVMARLDALQVGAADGERNGWLLAEFFLAHPSEESVGPLASGLVPA